MHDGNTPSVRVPAMGLGETSEIHAPQDWHSRIEALSPYLQYGPNFLRAIAWDMAQLDNAVRRGETTAAFDWLIHAESLAAYHPVRDGAR